ncbi:unnamed protein product [Arabidopsis lyrata]|nr:unnamed protein product [Arabidopsis lyrata]
MLLIAGVMSPCASSSRCGMFPVLSGVISPEVLTSRGCLSSTIDMVKTQMR